MSAEIVDQNLIDQTNEEVINESNEVIAQSVEGDEEQPPEPVERVEEQPLEPVEGDEEHPPEPVEEAIIAIADEDQINQTLGLTIAMVYLLDSCSDPDNRPLFQIQHIPYTADVIHELTEFKVQLYFFVIDRTNSLIALKDSPPFIEYVSELDQIWSEFEKQSDETTDPHCYELSQVFEEMVFHEKKFRQFLNQISCIQRAVQLIASDCDKQSTDFSDIFGADILERSLRKVNEFYTEIADRLSTRVDCLRQLINTVPKV